ncbi:MAG: hypothetical protein ACRD2A_26265, partial [Vicinamibacterales bacterium]
MQGVRYVRWAGEGSESSRVVAGIAARQPSAVGGRLAELDLPLQDPKILQDLRCPLITPGPI